MGLSNRNSASTPTKVGREEVVAHSQQEQLCSASLSRPLPFAATLPAFNDHAVADCA
jgi:hypothetical protein